MHRRRLRVIATAASGLMLGLSLAGAPAVRAAVSVNLDQWASTEKNWQNGNLNGNNSRYPEGGIVPFRLAIEGLKAGSHSITIQYDFTASGHKAYDFLATWNVTHAKGSICDAGGGAVSSMCPDLPSSSSAAFPSDPFKANGLSVRGAENYSGTPRRLTIWGGSITSISAPKHAGSVNGNSTGQFTVRFRSTGAAVLMAWGGHLAQSKYWDVSGGGSRDGASMVSGAPWHMRTLRLDGSGARNQDRSIQPSAIVGELTPGALAPTPRPTPRPAAPTATPRPTPRPAAPTASPRPTNPPARGAVPPVGTDPGGGDSGNPGAPTSWPELTPPATTTSIDVPATDTGQGLETALAVALGLGVLLAMTVRPGRRDRPGGPRRTATRR